MPQKRLLRLNFSSLIKYKIHISFDLLEINCFNIINDFDFFY